jgi:hypothetical protein
VIPFPTATGTSSVAQEVPALSTTATTPDDAVSVKPVVAGADDTPRRYTAFPATSQGRERLSTTEIDDIRGRLPDYLWREHGIDIRRGNFACLSGTHEDRHPSMSYYAPGRVVKCHACDFKADIFDLAERDFGTKGFVEALHELQRRGYAPDSPSYRPDTKPAPAPVTPKAKAEPVLNHSEFLEKAALHIGEAESYLKRRGISLTTCKRLAVGFDGTRLVFPYGVGGYETRDVRTAPPEGTIIKKQTAPVGLFNGDALAWGEPVFVCEGPFDCLSIEELGFRAVSIGGTSGVARLLEAVKGKRPSGALIIALDADASGCMASAKLAEELRAAGIPFSRPDPKGLFLGRKDSNEALVADPAGFSRRLGELVLAVEAGELVDAIAEGEAEVVDIAPEPVEPVNLAFTGEPEPMKKSKLSAADAQWVASNLADIMGKTYPPVRWAVEGLIPAGLTIISGDPKVGKSILSMNAVLGIASGQAVFGHFRAERGQVLWVALEDTEESIQERVATLSGMGLRREDFERVDVVTVAPTAMAGGLAKIDDWLCKHPDARLVVIDTWASIRDAVKPGGQAYYDDYSAIRALKAVADAHGIPIVLIHHANKSAHEDWTHSVSGTQGLTGGVDTIAVLKCGEGENDGVLRIKGRRVQARIIRLHREGFEWRYVGDEGAAAKASESAEAADDVPAFLMDCCREPDEGEHESPQAAVKQCYKNWGGSLKPKEFSEAMGRHDHPADKRGRGGRERFYQGVVLLEPIDAE